MGVACKATLIGSLKGRGGKWGSYRLPRELGLCKVGKSSGRGKKRAESLFFFFHLTLVLAGPLKCDDRGKF